MTTIKRSSVFFTRFLASSALLAVPLATPWAQAPVVSATQAVMASPASGLEAAVAALKEHRWTDAVTLYTPLVNVDDLTVRAQARYGLAIAFSQLGQEEQAYTTLDGTLQDTSPLGQAVGDLRGKLALQLADAYLAQKGPAVANPWLATYERLTTQPQRARYERIKGAYDTYAGRGPSRTLRVGVMLPLDGQLGDVGNSILHGLQLGLQQTDGRRGTKVEFLTVNTADGADAKVAAEKLLGQKPDVVVGPLLAAGVGEAAAVFAGHDVPLLALSNDKSVMGNGVYALNYLPSAQARLAAKAAVRLGHRKLAVLAPSNAYGSEALEAFADEAKREGATVVGTAYFDPTATDIGASIRQLTGPNDKAPLPFDGIFVPAPAAMMPLLKAQLAYYGVTNDTALLLGTGLWQNNDLLRTTSGMRGAVFTAPPKVDSFEQSYKATFGEDPNALALVGYDTARILTGLAAETQRTGQNVATLLQRPEGFYGDGGYFVFTPNGLTRRGLDVVGIGSQFEVKKAALKLAPLPLPADFAPMATGQWRF